MTPRRVDLVLHGPATAGSATPVSWALGAVRRAEPTPGGLAGALAVGAGPSADGAPGGPAIGAGARDDDAVLVWDARRDPPPAESLAPLLARPVDLRHAGLRLGAAGLPRLLDCARPTWMYGRDPDPTRPATSWRLHFGAALVRVGALRGLGGPDPGYATLLGAALDMGHRYLWSGAVVRFEPALAAPTGAETGVAETGVLPIEDEVRFLRRRYGDAWARWALARAVVSGRWPFAAAWRAWRATGSAGRRPPQAPLPPRTSPRGRATTHGLGVSVVVPTLDRYQQLEALLRELPAQTVPPREVVVIDQTPEPRRRRLAAQPPVVWLESDRQGQCSSRNLGIRRSTGDCLLFLDDDDADLPPDLIERHLANLAAFDAEVSCGVADEAGAGPLPVEFGLFRVADVLPTNNCMIRRRALERSGLFDLAYERGARADADLGMRLYLTGALALLDPRITVRHLRAPTGGLRAWGARRRTWAEGRRRLWRRHLPSVTELYLAHRYFSPAQVRERLWIAALSTLAGRGPTWRRAVTAGLGLVALPVTLAVLRRRRRAAERMLDRFPQIPLLEGRR